MKKIIFSVAAALGVVLTVLPHTAMARPETRSFKNDNKREEMPLYKIDKDSSYTKYDSAQGAQGTWWVWRWYDYYPESQNYCGASTGCSPEVSKSKKYSVAITTGSKVSFQKSIKGITSQVQQMYTNTITEDHEVRFTSRINLAKGETSYVGLIALYKDIPSAKLWGVWQKGKCTYDSELNGFEVRCGYRWVDKEVGEWKGEMITYHQTLLCASKSTMSPKSGDAVQNCQVPRMPYPRA